MLSKLTKIIYATELDSLTKAQLKELQSSLNKLGYDSGKVDGILGMNTEKAYQDYKKDNGWSRLTEIGKGTIDAMLLQLSKLEKNICSNRKINQAGINLIKEFEGLRLESYLCSSSVPTIGYGSIYYPDGSKVKLGEKITKKEAEDLLKITVSDFEVGVTKLVKVKLTDNQFAALVSFAFNVGLGALKTSTLLKVLNKSDYKEAANQFLRWNKGGGRVLEGLTRRRKAEKQLFEK